MSAEEVLTQAQAWEAYDVWMEDSRVLFLNESSSLDAVFRSLSRVRYPNPKTWSDSYLAAFAVSSGLRLVTFDQAFLGKLKQLLVLKP